MNTEGGILLEAFHYPLFLLSACYEGFKNGNIKHQWEQG